MHSQTRHSYRAASVAASAVELSQTFLMSAVELSQTFLKSAAELSHTFLKSSIATSALALSHRFTSFS
jgi:hypothetical protein